MMNRTGLVGGLLVGAAGIAVLWAAGVEFPVVVPPGVVILVVGAVLVSLVRARWAIAVGALLGVFVLVGFVLSGFNGDGFDNLVGDHGATVAAGQAIELVGVLTAAVVGTSLLVRRD